MSFDPSANEPRAELRVRFNHTQLEQRGELIVDVYRAGEYVASIYGMRGGVHIVSDVLALESRNDPFFFQPTQDGKPVKQPGYIVPLLKPNEVCPWCAGTGAIRVSERQQHAQLCPVCRGRKE